MHTLCQSKLMLVLSSLSVIQILRRLLSFWYILPTLNRSHIYFSKMTSAGKISICLRVVIAIRLRNGLLLSLDNVLLHFHPANKKFFKLNCTVFSRFSRIVGTKIKIQQKQYHCAPTPSRNFVFSSSSKFLAYIKQPRASISRVFHEITWIPSNYREKSLFAALF